jgi:microsomal dipeptidase-like Zn-dependent dipeptidase
MLDKKEKTNDRVPRSGMRAGLSGVRPQARGSGGRLRAKTVVPSRASVRLTWRRRPMTINCAPWPKSAVWWGKQPTLDDYMEHMEHALKIAGKDHVGIVSDVGIEPFDTSETGLADFNKEKEQRRSAGLAAPEEDRLPYVIGLNFPRKIGLIANQLLKRGYTAAVAEKVRGEFRRSPQGDLDELNPHRS